MKLIIITATVLVGSMAWSQGEPAKDNIAEKKTRTLEMIDKRIASLNEFKTCVNGATEPSAMKACWDKHHDAMMSMRMDMEEHRHQRRMEHMKKRADKKGD